MSLFVFGVLVLGVWVGLSMLMLIEMYSGLLLI